MILNEENYVDKAQEVIEYLAQRANRRNPMVTTSKIRKLLSVTADIYKDLCLCVDDKLDNSIIIRINYLKILCIYEAGRDDKNTGVRNFIKKSEMIRCIEEIQGIKKRFILFNKYMEALIAYHRYYGGKEI